MYRGGRAAVGALAALLAIACARPPVPPEVNGEGGRTLVPEAELRRIRLAPPLDTGEAELSGLTWWGDELVLLPQYPERLGGALFTASRDAVAHALATGARLPTERLPLRQEGHHERLAGYEGFEAVAFAGDLVFFLLEIGGGGARAPAGVMLRGRLVEGGRAVRLPSGGSWLPSQGRVPNLAYESLVVFPTTPEPTLLVLHETQGVPNAEPSALVRIGAGRVERCPVEALEYRVTDATAPDAQGRFWVTNYHWPGEPWSPGRDALAARFGVGATHAERPQVERLVELRFDGARVAHTGTPPIPLRLGEQPRNWEGVVRFRDGFLVVTDKHPETILAFVESPPAGATP